MSSRRIALSRAGLQISRQDNDRAGYDEIWFERGDDYDDHDEIVSALLKVMSGLGLRVEQVYCDDLLVKWKVSNEKVVPTAREREIHELLRLVTTETLHGALPLKTSMDIAQGALELLTTVNDLRFWFELRCEHCGHHAHPDETCGHCEAKRLSAELEALRKKS
jgi:hypothetical protein